jgi:uncharacterized protein (AIM24 family)
VQFSVTRIPGIANVVFGDDGFHVVMLTGPGRVWLQSMPLPVLAHALARYMPRADNTAQSASSGAIGGIIGDMLRGN